MVKLLTQKFSIFRVAGRCNDVLTESEFCDSPSFLFNFVASPRRNFLSDFSILFTGPCPAGCFFSLVITSFSTFSFCLMLLPYTHMHLHALTSFSGLRRCVCVSLILIRRARSGSCSRVFVWVCVYTPTKPGTSFWRYLFSRLETWKCVCVCVCE